MFTLKLPSCLLFCALCVLFESITLKAQDTSRVVEPDSSRTTFTLPNTYNQQSLTLPNWQLSPERYPHLRSPLIQDPEAMLLYWHWDLEYLQKRPKDPKKEMWTEMNQRFLDYLEMERLKQIPVLDRLRMGLGAFRPVFDALAVLLGMQMGALRGYTYGADFNLKVTPRSYYSDETMQQRFQRQALFDPKVRALYKQFVWMESTGWTRPADAMPATTAE